MSSTPSTETRGAWLWRKMMNVYGARFLDMWEGVDVAEMQVTWTEALRGTSREALQRGIAALYHAKHPPTLPEFIDLCRPQQVAQRQNTLALIDAERTQPAEARVQLAKVREIAEEVMRAHPHGSTGVTWAERLLERAAHGEHISLHQITYAKDAIDAWSVTHVRIDREPGSDDEEVL